MQYARKYGTSKQLGIVGFLSFTSVHEQIQHPITPQEIPRHQEIRFELLHERNGQRVIGSEADVHRNTVEANRAVWL